MPNVPTEWNLKKINDWFQRSIDKERARLTNAPKPHKGDRLSVPENFSNFAPPVATFRKKDARRHR